MANRTKNSQTLGFDHLPLEILFEIIKRLLISSIGRLRCTCKFWNNFFKDSNVVAWHLRNSIQNPGFIYSKGKKKYYLGGEADHANIEEIKPNFAAVSSSHQCPYSYTGSAGGLLAYYSNSPSENRFHICNPITREFVKIPRQNHEFPFQLAWGFAYSSSTKEYMIVRFGYGGVKACITQFGYSTSHPSTIIHKNFYFGGMKPNPIFLGATYSLGSNSWKELSHVPFPPWGLHVDLNGTLFWFIWNCFYEGKEMVMSFNIDTQKFKALPGPPVEIMATSAPMFMNISGKTLGFVDGDLVIGFKIWVLVDQENGVWVNKDKILTMYDGWKAACWRNLWKVHLKSRFVNRHFFCIQHICNLTHIEYGHVVNYSLFIPPSDEDGLSDHLFAIPHAGSLVSPKEIARIK
ncbi:hypothetical protein CCACVL1_25259 [Corchorus capsularis]|uniref:F-box domain-containing protein n=1 Tax=Corchorus capsularis TaxID=210143 RepID=A0A1R3GLF4_COCAP|nr:hypothetical protein CCACVL1_25259 [Corchorus capsularis]